MSETTLRETDGPLEGTFMLKKNVFLFPSEPGVLGLNGIGLKDLSGKVSEVALSRGLEIIQESLTQDKDGGVIFSGGVSERIITEEDRSEDDFGVLSGGLQGG